MMKEAELLYESLNSSNAPGFLEEEWGQLFTIAQRKVVINILKEGVNKNAFNQLAISPLIQEQIYYDTDFEGDTHFKETNKQTVSLRLKSTVQFETKFFWILDEFVILMDTSTVPATNHFQVPVKRITYDFYRINLDNPFRTPTEDDGYWLLQHNNGVTIIGNRGLDGQPTVTSYHIIGVYHPDNYPIVSGVTYPPPPVGFTGTQASVLNPSVHPKIVEEAVTLARMSVTDAQGYQLAVAEFNK